MDVFFWHHQLQECSRNSFLVVSLFRAIREAQIDLDSIAESLHRKLDPKGGRAFQDRETVCFCGTFDSKNSLTFLKDLQPERAESSAVRKLQSVQAETWSSSGQA